MNVDKINDFISVWAQTIGLTNSKCIDVIKEDIIKRCATYEDVMPFISTDEDKCQAYIIKPIDGKYSLEDFFLNRLMLGLREMDITGAGEGNNADYNADKKVFSIDIKGMSSRFDDKVKRHKGLEGKKNKIITKTIEHEIGHCLKTTFTDGCKESGENAKKLEDLYRMLINNLATYKDGKYAEQIKKVSELNFSENSKKIKTGIKEMAVKKRYADTTPIDELLNETEALDLTDSNEIQETWGLQKDEKNYSSSKNYVNVYNYMSGYNSFTGYGKILKSLLGKKECFQAEYMSALDILKQFDTEYSDIVQEVWGLDPQKMPPTICLAVDFSDLTYRNKFNEDVMLKLDEFFAKCYEKKISKLLENNNGQLTQEQKEAILSEINEFTQRMTINDDDKKNNALKHNSIFSSIKSRVNQLEKGPVSGELKEMKQQGRMQFVQRFLDLYDNTETEYQQETRLELESSSIQRVLDIVGKKGMQISDLIDVRYIDIDGTGERRPEYTAKQFSAMARLLKAAEGLNNDKDVNTNGVNYLEQFTAVPQIKNILLAMSQDFKYEGTYLHQLRDEYKKSKSVGDMSDSSTLEEVSDDETTVSHKLNKTMGITYEQREVQQAKTSSQSFRESVASKTSRTIPQKVQTNKTTSQSFRESVANDTKKQGISEESEQQTKTSSQRFRDFLYKARRTEKTGITDVKKSQENMGLRKERGILVRQSLQGQLDEDGKRRLEEINRLLNIKNVNVQQFEANKRRQGQSR